MYHEISQHKMSEQELFSVLFASHKDESSRSNNLGYDTIMSFVVCTVQVTKYCDKGLYNFSKKFRGQLKILGAKTVRRRKFHTEEPLKLCATKQNL